MANTKNTGTCVEKAMVRSDLFVYFVCHKVPGGYLASEPSKLTSRANIRSLTR